MTWGSCSKTRKKCLTTTKQSQHEQNPALMQNLSLWSGTIKGWWNSIWKPICRNKKAVQIGATHKERGEANIFFFSINDKKSMSIHFSLDCENDSRQTSDLSHWKKIYKQIWICFSKAAKLLPNQSNVHWFVKNYIYITIITYCYSAVAKIQTKEAC